MRSKGNNSTAAQKRWREAVADYGCVVTRSPNIQIHHCVGSTAKHNKIHIGEWFILPLAIELHDVGSPNPNNITLHKKAFVEAYGTEKQLFKKMFKDIVTYKILLSCSSIAKTGFSGIDDLPPVEVFDAIMDYHK